MDGESLRGSDGAALVDRLTNHVDDSAESFRTDGHLNRVASVNDGLATHEALRRVERNRTDRVATQMLGDLEDETVLGALDLEGVVDRREFSIELHVDDGTDDLGDFTSGGAEATYYQTKR